MPKRQTLLLLLICTSLTQGIQALPPKEIYVDHILTGYELCQATPTLDEGTQEGFVALATQLWDREAEYEETHYQLVTAIDPNYLSYLVVLKEYYRLRDDKDYDDFEFLRAQDDPRLESTLDSFFRKFPHMAGLRLGELWKAIADNGVDYHLEAYGLRQDDFLFLLGFRDPQYRDHLNSFLQSYPSFQDLSEEETINRFSKGTPDIRSYFCLYAYHHQEDPVVTVESLWEYFCQDTVGDDAKVVAANLIAASPSLENFYPAESALDIYTNGFSMNMLRRDTVKGWLAEVFELEGISLDVEQLETLVRKEPSSADTRRGILVQIFIPKSEISTVAYPSKPYGRGDYWSHLPEAWFEFYDTFRSSSKFKVYQDAQLRILAGALTPDRDKLFLHTDIDADELESYRQEVRYLLQNIMQVAH